MFPVLVEIKKKMVVSPDKVGIYYETTSGEKSKPTLFFIHGWMANLTVWEKEREFFSRLGYPTIAIDLRGHGKSDKPDKKEEYHLEYFAKDIDHILKQEKINKCVIIGHSMGGMVSLVFYKLFQKKCMALVLINTTYTNPLKNWPLSIEKATPFLEHVVDFILENEHVKKQFSHIDEFDFTKYRKVGIFELLHEAMINSPVKSVLSCLEAMFGYDVTSILPKIKVPVLIIASYVDHVLPLIDQIQTDQKIEKSKLIVLTDTHHVSTVDKPEEISEAMINFFKFWKI